MKTPEQIAQEHAAIIARGENTITMSPEALAEFLAAAIKVDRAQREDEAPNPIIEAYQEATREPLEERFAYEMFITPEAEWLEYIEKDLIGFDYTQRQKIMAKAHIMNRRAEKDYSSHALAVQEHQRTQTDRDRHRTQGYSTKALDAQEHQRRMREEA